MARSTSRVTVDDGITLVRRNGSTLWTARIFVRARETWRSSGFRTIEPAKAWARELRARLELEAAGLAVPVDRRTTLPELVGEWRAEFERRGRDAEYARVASNRVLEVLASFRGLDEITPDLLKQALERVAHARRPKPGARKLTAAALAEPLAPSSQHAYLSAVRRFFGWLQKTKRWATNPATEVDGTEVVPVQPRREITLEESLRLLAVAPLDRRACYAVAMVTGLRRKELEALRWANVQLGDDGGKITLLGRATKNRRAAAFRLPPSVVQVLRELRAWRMGVRDRRREAGKHGATAVGWQDGDRAIEVPTNDTLRRDLVRAGVDPSDQGVGKLTMHSLRGGLSTGLKDLGVSLSLRQAAMRHADPALTENTYTQLHEGELDAAIDRLGAVLAPALAPDHGANVVAPTDAPTTRHRPSQPVSIRPSASAAPRRGKARQG